MQYEEMQQEELKKSKKLFPKKTIHINSTHSGNSQEQDKLLFDINQLLKKNEDIIIAYLERCIYTSNLSHTTIEQIQTIFNNVKANIIHKS